MKKLLTITLMLLMLLMALTVSNTALSDPLPDTDTDTDTELSLNAGMENPIETKQWETVFVTTAISIASDQLLDFNLMPASNLILDDHMAWYKADATAFTLSMLYGTANGTLNSSQAYTKDDFLHDFTLTVSTRLLDTLFGYLYK